MGLNLITPTAGAQDAESYLHSPPPRMNVATGSVVTLTPENPKERCRLQFNRTLVFQVMMGRMNRHTCR